MVEALVLLDGGTFFVSSPSRDVEPGADASGYFFADMRHLSTWQLLADGEPLTVLSSGTVDYYSASIHATLARAQVGKNPAVTINIYFVLCYCGLIVPVVGVGVASEFFADFAAVVAFSILLAALSVLPHQDPVGPVAGLGGSVTASSRSPEVSGPRTDGR